MMMGDLWRVGGNIAVSRAIGKTQQPLTMLENLLTRPISKKLKCRFLACTV